MIHSTTVLPPCVVNTLCGSNCNPKVLLPVCSIYYEVFLHAGSPLLRWPSFPEGGVTPCLPAWKLNFFMIISPLSCSPSQFTLTPLQDLYSSLISILSNNYLELKPFLQLLLMIKGAFTPNLLHLFQMNSGVFCLVQFIWFSLILFCMFDITYGISSPVLFSTNNAHNQFFHCFFFATLETIHTGV